MQTLSNPDDDHTSAQRHRQQGGPLPSAHSPEARQLSSHLEPGQLRHGSTWTDDTTTASGFRPRTFSQSSPTEQQHNISANQFPSRRLSAQNSQELEPLGSEHLEEGFGHVTDRGSLELPSAAYRKAPVQILVNNSQYLADHSVISPTSEEGSASASSTYAAPAEDPRTANEIQRQRQTAHQLTEPDEEGVWEDEEDGNDSTLDATGFALDSDASEGEDETVDEELRQQRRTYREAVQQYRSSRTALLRSGHPSYASSPSPDHHIDAARQRRTLSPTPRPGDSLSRKSVGSPDIYLSASNAESIDAADSPGRAHDAVFADRRDSVQHRRASPVLPESYVEELDQYGHHHPSNRHDREQNMPSSPRYLLQTVPHPSTNSPEDAAAANSDDKDEAEAYASEQSTPTLEEARSSTPASSTFHEAEPGKFPPSPRFELHPTLSDGTTPGMQQVDGNARHLGLAVQGQGRDLSEDARRTDQRDATKIPSTPRGTSRSLSRQPRHWPSVDDTGASEKQALQASENASNSKKDAGGGRSESAHLPASDATRENPTTGADAAAPFSLWDYLQEEVLATDFDSTQEMKWERVTNFIAIPFWMEKIIMFGFVVCLDSFLYTFTILPLRFAVAMYTWLGNLTSWALGGEKRYLHSSHKCDLLKVLLIGLSCFILSRITDASKMYHSVRGQDVVKLSVIFNVLEIADRLCCSFGQDLLDSLFSRMTLARRKNGKQPYLRPLGFFLLSLAYILAHTLVLFYQLVTLNVAINSYDNALLTLLLSNQFVEIKGSVFKKFEKENVFQMTCADIVERFQLTLMLTAIGLRNLIELSGGATEGGASPLPASFTVFPSLSLLETVLTPLCIVLMSECFVDWLKHAFITKFNHIRPAVYGRFMDVLCRDLVVGGPSQRNRKHTFVDQSPIVSRRLGFATLPLACLLVRITGQVLGMIGDTSHIDECAIPGGLAARNTSLVGTAARRWTSLEIDSATVQWLDLVVRGSTWTLTLIIAWAFLVAVKLLLGANLVSFASHRYATMHQREAEENLNSRDRAPIGVDKDELSYDKKVVQLVDRNEDNAVQIMLDGRHVVPAEKGSKPEGQTKEKKGSSLMDVSRYTMVRSRIW